MAKMITRTITVYTYTLGTFNPETLQVEGVTTERRPYKLNGKERRQLETTTGKSILAEVQSEALYGMSLETFLAWATELKDGE